MSVPRLGLLLAVVATVAFTQELDFKAAERQIVRLPPAAFPMLPKSIVGELQRRGCMIPQETFSKTPNNVVSGEFAKRGQKDWAVLCSVKGASSILVFWNGSARNPADLGAADDMRNYLQGVWPWAETKSDTPEALPPQGSKFINDHYQAYGGPKPPPIDHDGIDDAFLEKGSVVQYFSNGKWVQLTGSD